MLESLVGFQRTIWLQLFGISSWGIDLDYYNVEWFALEKNRDRFVVLEIAPRYSFLDSFVDYEDYSISSKRFLLSIVNVMALWLKFSHSYPFYFTGS